MDQHQKASWFFAHKVVVESLNVSCVVSVHILAEPKV